VGDFLVISDFQGKEVLVGDEGRLFRIEKKKKKKKWRENSFFYSKKKRFDDRHTQGRFSGERKRELAACGDLGESSGICRPEKKNDERRE